jgi:hypothetical protein
MNIPHQIKPNLATETPSVETGIQANDVLFGRGNRTKYHSGNTFYRILISTVREAITYFSHEKKKRMGVHIYECIRSLEPPGRFLYEYQDEQWSEADERASLKKINQALREKKCRSPDSHEHYTDQLNDKQREIFQSLQVCKKQCPIHLNYKSNMPFSSPSHYPLLNFIRMNSIAFN